jgi:hypothetical protein
VIVFKTLISTRGIILGSIGITVGLFFLSMTFQMSMVSNVNEIFTLIAIEGIRGIFIGITLYALIGILNLKIIYLTENSLVLRKPMLFSKKEILFNEINRIERKDYKIEVANKSVFSSETHNVYQGKQMIIWLKRRKSIKLNSFEIGDYKALISKFSIIYNQYKISSTN